MSAKVVRTILGLGLESIGMRQRCHADWYTPHCVPGRRAERAAIRDLAQVSLVIRIAPDAAVAGGVAAGAEQKTIKTPDKCSSAFSGDAHRDLQLCPHRLLQVLINGVEEAGC